MPISEYVQYGIFAILALVTVGGAIQVISTRSIIHAAFWLFPVFAGIAGFYLLLDAQFLAMIQVLIYIGAILVLIIFAVTLTRKSADTDEPQSNRFVLPMVLAALMLTAALVGVFYVTSWPPVTANIDDKLITAGAGVTDVSGIGLVLLQQYLLPFEITSVLLLAAMIGAIALARKERSVTKVSPAEEEKEWCP